MPRRVRSLSLTGLNRIMERAAPRAAARGLTVGAVVTAVNDPEIGTGAGLVTIGVSLAGDGLGRWRQRRQAARDQSEAGVEGP